MKNLARGVFLCFAALIISLFGFQPQVGEASVSADINSQEQGQGKLQQNNQQTARPRVVETENDKDTKAKFKNSALNSDGMSFSATAYCLKGRTATGGSVRRGIVAADPRHLPLGSRITITSGSYSGSYIVADTGGGIKGRKLDIWVPTCSEAVRFGRRAVIVKRS